MDRLIIFKNNYKKAIEGHKVASKKYESLLDEINQAIFDKDDK